MGRFRNQSVSGSNPVAERRKINGRFQVLTWTSMKTLSSKMLRRVSS
jgi:hypothetical protein